MFDAEIAPGVSEGRCRSCVSSAAGPSATNARQPRRGPRPAALRGGFVPLLDAAPLVMARELGYFADEGLNVVLERQIGWGNVRDKLVYGHLHASHALVGMPPSSVLGRERWAEPVAAIATLSRGGNGITLGRRLTAAGVNSAAALAEWICRRLGDGPPVMAHVF